MALISLLLQSINSSLKSLSLSLSPSLFAKFISRKMEMESSIPIAKRVWNLVRVAFFMLRKGISKGKLLMDLNMMLKRRRKIAGKAISNLMFHHHHHHHHDGSSHHQFSGQHEYEFSCSNTPNNFFFSIGGSKRHHHSRHPHHHNHSLFFACAHEPPTQDDEVVVKAVLEMLNNEVMVEASPALPGFGRSPMVRQLRVTDSPFPLRDTDGDHQVDKAAEEFIKKFYKELKNQN
ncbi:uncharacterized protein LOC129291825 [Prosopis cineraria]|uniref:uncharacterized protein LOC129291825 n=1 Tax=Prosopis cineraria TaxID=364024 RepID=UPI0024100ECE|nr:uncharacterized protein LOC129291825 [Prosopis cineraria]